MASTRIEGTTALDSLEPKLLVFSNTTRPTRTTRHRRLHCLCRENGCCACVLVASRLGGRPNRRAPGGACSAMAGRAPSLSRSRRHSDPAAQLTRATAVLCSCAAASRVASVWPVAVKRNWIWLVVEARPARLAWSRLHCDSTSKRHARGWRWFGSTGGPDHGRVFRTEPRPALVKSGPEPHRQIRPGVGFC